MNPALLYRQAHILDVGMAHVMMANLDHWRRVAAPHAGCTPHTHPGGISAVRERIMERLCASQLAGERIAHPQSYLRRWGLFIVDDIEMGVESGRFIHGGHGQIHESRKGPEAGHGEITVCVLQSVQVLDKAIAVSQ